MSVDFLVRRCSPTLAGIKTGNLFSYPCYSKEGILSEIRELNRILSKKGIRALPLRYSEDRVLIYVYRPVMLVRDLSAIEALDILKEAGYKSNQPSQCIPELIRRLNEAGEFPHEIGLFLGYPPEDVRGFIENKGASCKCCGRWKVYGNEAKARHLFEMYEKCTDIFCKQAAKGISIEQLAVSL